jgi:NAD+ diphosphatase
MDLLWNKGNGGLSLPSAKDLATLGIPHEGALYLGQLDGRPLCTLTWDQAPSGEDKKSLPQPFRLKGLRSLFGEVGPDLFDAAGRAVHISDWSTSSRFCGACGERTQLSGTERAMTCPACKRVYYPRISPAVIVLVTRGEEALLARGTRFPLPFFSTLAGFSEVGESLEQTLAREVREEVGIEVRDIRYFGSQPWPFPNSLMLGFFAEHAGGELVLDPDEIAEAAWFRRDELPVVPPPVSIARQLIDAWVAGTHREGHVQPRT